MDAAPRLAHIVLQTAQIDAMERWWCAAVGMHRVAGNDMLRFFTNDHEHHRLALVQNASATPKDRKAAGLNHVAFTIGSLTALLERYDSLASQEIKPFWVVNHGMTISAYYSDPDGNGVELQVDNFDSVDQANDYIASGAFRENPIGVPWDPDDLLSRLRDGATEGDLMALVRPAPATMS